MFPRDQKLLLAQVGAGTPASIPAHEPAGIPASIHELNAAISVLVAAGAKVGGMGLETEASLATAAWPVV